MNYCPKNEDIDFDSVYYEDMDFERWFFFLWLSNPLVVENAERNGKCVVLPSGSFCCVNRASYKQNESWGLGPLFVLFSLVLGLFLFGFFIFLTSLVFFFSKCSLSCLCKVKCLFSVYGCLGTASCLYIIDSIISVLFSCQVSVMPAVHGGLKYQATGGGESEIMCFIPV